MVFAERLRVAQRAPGTPGSSSGWRAAARARRVTRADGAGRERTAPARRRPQADRSCRRRVAPRPGRGPGGRALVCTLPSTAMALVSINELPENILLELFTHVPARQLLLHCRPVCSLWRDLIDVVTLWKRKCLREGFVTEDWDQPVADWKIFYFLCSLRRNLLRNPCAEEDMGSWRIDSNGGDHWKVESLPGEHGTDFPDPQVKKYFVTSYGMCLKSQLVDLKAEGYWEELLDTFRPEIVVKDWFAARADCGCSYHIRVQLASADYIVLASFEPPPVTIHQWNDATWTEVSHTFSDYPPGVRHILFQHGGKDTQFWAGWYGPRVTNSSIIISPKTSRSPAPSGALPETLQGQGEAS
ncbi:F-box only protein 6 isoform X1 [Ictidomys tridecemlineatus]